MFDAKKFFTTYGIAFITEGHKHCQRGWVQTTCPFCRGNEGWHLGYNAMRGFFHCWRCGWKTIPSVITAFTGSTFEHSKKIIKDHQSYGTSFSYNQIYDHGQAEVCEYPVGTSTLTTKHKKYLRERKFDPDKIEKVWGVKSTGPVGPYKHRIIIPIRINGKLVSYQGRDTTNKSQLKYKACKMKDEAIHHKNILYGLDHTKTGRCVVVEGVTDVWRLGPGAVCTFGIKIKTIQKVLLATKFKKVFFLFDSEIQAQEEAEKTACFLEDLGVDVDIFELENGDPAEMSQEQAQELMLHFKI